VEPLGKGAIELSGDSWRFRLEFRVADYLMSPASPLLQRAAIESSGRPGTPAGRRFSPLATVAFIKRYVCPTT
jgi:hypothetical protein